ncbi:helix-turn-helix domain-containing protein [Schaalia radingae]|uniref:Helix-turn-helix domain-containing protein n=1 Tax=Schaalia radingae TaxID=131110 RepID=A0ABY0V565_9ACTO|nr:helix-turn-helix domain-containing protein [Schaalia radingae]SDT85840.1 Helix-turn-helix domain-containing protein [Schaalia radingae]
MSTSKRKPLEPLYTVRQVAERYSTTPNAVRKWIDTDRLQGAIRLTSRRILVPESSLRAMENNAPRY